MALLDTLGDLLARASYALGLENADRFPRGHAYAHTRWNKAYFDIPSDLKPEQMESIVCAAIANTPHVFGEIRNPTPRMQRALLAVIESRLRRADARADLVHLLIRAYRQPHTPDIVPGLRAQVAGTRHDDIAERARSVMAFLSSTHSPFDVIEMKA